MGMRGTFLVDFLTREEFQCVWAVSFVADVTREAYGGERLTGEESVGELLRHGIRELARAGFVFEALRVGGEGEIVVLRQTPVEIRNRLYVAKLQAGSMPSPLVAIGSLVRAVRERRKGELSLDVSPALAVAKGVAEAREFVLEQVQEDGELSEALQAEREMDWEILRQAFAAAARAREEREN